MALVAILVYLTVGLAFIVTRAAQGAFSVREALAALDARLQRPSLTSERAWCVVGLGVGCVLCVIGWPPVVALYFYLQREGETT